MNEKQKYLFDLQGFIEIENALDQTQLASLNSVMDEKIKEHMKPETSSCRFMGGLLNWGRTFLIL